MKKCIFTLCLIIVSGFLSAQSVDRKIPLKKGKSRHLHANLILQNKLPVRGMIESGVPILVMDSTFVFNHLDDLNISLVESKATLNLAGNKYKCTHITNDTIFVNGLFYKGKTVVIVAHRLSTVRHADKIVVLDKGKIAEEGSHQELTQKQGLYFNLVRNQLELGQ